MIINFNKFKEILNEEFNLDFSRLPDDNISYTELFRQRDLENKIEKEKKQKIKTVKNRSKIEFKLNLDNDTIKFINYFYNHFEELVEEYGVSTVKTFLLSLIGYINDGVISRRRIYEFVNKFDRTDKIRKFTFDTFDYSFKKIDNWHPVGGSFSFMISKLCTDTGETEENGVNGMECAIFQIPTRLFQYVKDVINIYESDNVILLDHNYNSGDAFKKNTIKHAKL